MTIIYLQIISTSMHAYNNHAMVFQAIPTIPMNLVYVKQPALQNILRITLYTFCSSISTFSDFF